MIQAVVFAESQVEMEDQALDLWFAYPDDLLAEEAARTCASLLSEDEQIRLHSFRFDRDRRQYLASRWLVRQVLSLHAPREPIAWRFRHNSFGKPEIEPDCGLRFNLSHSSALAACVLSRGLEVGIDVEPLQRSVQVVEIAGDILSSEELVQFEALDSAQKQDRALSLWVLKEAYIKCLGQGLSFPLKQLSFLFEGDCDIRIELDPQLNAGSEFWRFSLIDHAGHRVAVVAKGATNPDLRLWEIRMPSSATLQLAPVAAPWFPVRRRLS